MAKSGRSRGISISLHHIVCYFLQESGGHEARAGLHVVRRTTQRRVNGKPRDVTLDIKRRIRLVIAPSIFLAVTAYFGWSATQGNRGLVAQAERVELLRKVEADNALAKQERTRWEIRVAGLRTAQLNLDTLDERARVMLNLADPADIVVQYRENEKP
jgi:cell division protein FtsB